MAEEAPSGGTIMCDGAFVCVICPLTKYCTDEGEY